MSVSRVLFVAAVVCFALLVFGVQTDVRLLPLGLGFMALGHAI